jgi:hypothetical protein
VSRADDQPSITRAVSLATACRECDWPREELIYRLQNDQPYETIPPGHVIDWHNSMVKSSLDVEAGTVQITKVDAAWLDTVTVVVKILLPADAAGAPIAESTTTGAPIAGPAANAALPVSKIVFELASRCPKRPGEGMRGRDGWAQRMIRSDPRLADEKENTIANRWYEWNKLPKP